MTNYYLEGPGGLPGLKQSPSGNTNKPFNFNGLVTFTGGTAGVSGDVSVPANLTGSNANALSVAKTGTNYAFNVDTSVTSAATGLNIKSAAAASGLALSTISSGTNENLTIDAKGSGTVTINGTATTSGTVTIGNSTSSAGIAINGPTLVTSVSANSLTIGPNGTTNPVLNIDSSTASSNNGINVKSSNGSGVTISVISGSTTDGLTVTGKGAGVITLGTTSNLINFAQTAIAVGGGASATLSTIGGSGPATAAQNAWLKVNVAGTGSFIPFWR